MLERIFRRRKLVDYSILNEYFEMKKDYNEIKIDNDNFTIKCEEQAKKIFYEKKTPVSCEWLDCPVPSLYHIEINSQCNLRCKLCGAGNLSSFQTVNGVMKLEYFRDVIEKIKEENINATILPFGNSEPFLNKNIYNYIDVIKMNNLKCTLSSNLNIFSNVESVLMLEPDIFIISISGYSQDIYSRAHRGGNIDIIKHNMKKLSEIKYKNKLKTNIIVNYHLYNYNWGDEFDKSKSMSLDFGFEFAPSCARSISMEMTLQYMNQREKDKGAVVTELPFPIELPKNFHEGLEFLIVKPDDIFDMYSDVPSAIVCPFANFETYIRADGSVQLCGCCSDRRLSLTPNYLNISHEDIRRKRRWHPFCEVCLRTKTYLYFNMVDLKKWDALVKERLPTIPSDRLICGD